MENKNSNIGCNLTWIILLFILLVPTQCGSDVSKFIGAALPGNVHHDEYWIEYIDRGDDMFDLTEVHCRPHDGNDMKKPWFTFKYKKYDFIMPKRGGLCDYCFSEREAVIMMDIHNHNLKEELLRLKRCGEPEENIKDFEKEHHWHEASHFCSDFEYMEEDYKELIE